LSSSVLPPFANYCYFTFSFLPFAAGFTYSAFSGDFLFNFLGEGYLTVLVLLVNLVDLSYLASTFLFGSVLTGSSLTLTDFSRSLLVFLTSGSSSFLTFFLPTLSPSA